MPLDTRLALEEEREIIIDLGKTLDRLDLTVTTANNSTNLNTESAKIISDFIDYDISLEDDAMVEYKQKLSTLYSNLNSIIIKQFKSFSPLINLTSDYKVDTLTDLKTRLNSGELVPKSIISDKDTNSLNSKLAPFYASGYSLKSGPADIVTYINGMISISNRSGKYYKGLDSMYVALKDDKKDLPKLNGITNIARGLSNVTSTASRKYKITDFRLSILSSWLGNNVNVLFVSKNSKGAFKVYIDNYKINSFPKVGIAKKEQLVKLLDASIKVKKDIDKVHKELSFIIKKFTRDSSIALLNSAADGNSRQFLLANYTKSIVRALINTYVDLTKMDSVIELYIKAVTEKGK